MTEGMHSVFTEEPRACRDVTIFFAVHKKSINLYQTRKKRLEKMKRTYLLVLCLMIAGTGFLQGQGLFRYPGMFSIPPRTPDARIQSDDAFGMGLMQPGSFDLDIDLGTSFGSAGGLGNVYGTYLAPRFSYQASERFRLTGGVVFSTTGMNASFTMPVPEGMNMFSGSGSSMLAYASGQYLVTPKLLISGTAYKNFAPGAKFGQTNGIFPQNMDFQGMSMSLDYQLAKGVSLGASFHYDNNPFGFGYSPFHRNSGYLPLPWRY